MTCTLTNWAIDSGESRVILPGNDIDIGLIARRNQTGFVAVDLGMGADPATFTPELVLSERMGMGGRVLDDGTIRDSWRFRKEYLRDATAASGQPVFEPEWLDFQSQHVREPLYRMDIDPADWWFAGQPDTGRELPEGYRRGPMPPERYPGEPCPAVIRDHVTREVVIRPSFWLMTVDERERELSRWLVPNADGRIACWLDPWTRPAGLPDSMASGERQFAAGADVGEGVSASETTCIVLASDTREQAAEFGSNRITPGDFGLLMAAICRYFNQALALPVRKMHGITVLRSLVDEAGYSYVWHDHVRERQVETQTASLGWAKGETSDDYLFGKWVQAIKGRDVILHSAELVRQHGQYIYDEAGRVCLSALAGLSTEERRRHGDRTVGAALAWRAMLDLTQFVKVVPVETAPVNSRAWRDKAVSSRSKDKARW